MRFRTKAAAVTLTTAVLVGAVAVPAFAAEGTINTSMTQVQPGFKSRTWIDHNSTSTSTSVYLGGCTDNAGGHAPGSKTLTSVTIDLWLVDSGGDLIVSYGIHKCGTYSFGRMPAGTYYFTVNAINGDTSADRSNFLNSNPVTITY